MRIISSKRRLLITAAVVVLAALAAAAYPQLSRYLLTQVSLSPATEEEEQVIEKKLWLTVPDDARPGEYQFRVGWEDPLGNNLPALGGEVTMVVGDGGGNNKESGGGHNGDDGDNGEDDGGETPVETLRTYAFAPSRGHEVSGVYSGIEQDEGLTVVKLAHGGARMVKQVAMPRDNYWLYINVKHDSPGPVDAAVYLNDKVWKIIRLDKSDNRYRTHRVGLLRNFSGGAIRFRLLNDVYDKSDPVNEAKDRNLYVASWGLTNDPNRLLLKNVTSQAVGGGRLNGWTLLPRLNQIIREELGRKFIAFEVWEYYARRMTVSPARRESIQSEARLREVMRYWRGARPGRPWGD